MPLGVDFFAIVDPQHGQVGAPPVYWFLDEWARHKSVKYYVAGLSAAEMHGAAHQRPQVFQIAVNKSIRPFKFPGMQIVFLYKKSISADSWEHRKVPTGYVRVSTPEMTAYDLLATRKACPSLNHAATVLAELGEAMRADRLAELCRQGYGLVPLQRLGWLLDHLGWSKLTGRLAGCLARRGVKWRPLDQSLPSRGNRNERWHIVENTDIQPDVTVAGGEGATA